ncbi:MAG: hypothetical protein LBC20_07980 [Planctomycetaceae bacterium]|jgi:hypothetical protein|nr:hypothetical protein [Planctomycetaceae bacterium]
MFFRGKKKRVGETLEIGGQDSFLDLVSNVVGILLILLMVAGIRAQNSPPETETINPSAPTVDHKILADIQRNYETFQEKELTALKLREDVNSVQAQMEILDEHIQIQAIQHAKLFDMMTSVRAAIETVAEEKDQETKEKIEYQRQLQEIETKLGQISRTKQWLQANRPQSTVIENIPTPISKSVGEKDREAHFRLLGGKIVYVPFLELFEKMKLEIAQNQNQYFKQKISENKIGPFDDFYLEYMLAAYDTPMQDAYGTGVGKSLQLEYAEMVPIQEPLGEPLKNALILPDSELKRRLKIYRQDIYTITVWVYPDSFEEFIELKKFLYAQGYRVAARPLEFGMPISGSPRGSKSAAQ